MLHDHYHFIKFYLPPQVPIFISIVPAEHVALSSTTGIIQREVPQRTSFSIQIGLLFDFLYHQERRRFPCGS